ncbi:hypothetical protein CLV24_101270 [Pontibacter ummariensis]|uniref:Outer membrane protein beta-barrel domain-containing protein n=1 Tax=Pontibacter ummariensis TaxID=1610492 RepID=A0A239BBV3_9BACT|nr:hypothetical protein [Pontibacter ummariensis]PRY16424.1 hypothetical protein CLV24_101270 [Pontibacter ummariensis]SNS04918.1 hypothetical protein SAMN06296052_101270 [Pontibacter ummariensis]
MTTPFTSFFPPSNLTYYSLLLALILTGCGTSMYMPAVPNVPMFTQKGELSAGGHVTPKGNITFNTAYAVSDHFGVLLNGSMLSSERRKRDMRYNQLEAGGGYFTTFGANDNRVLEVYAGFGGGSSDRTDKEEDGETGQMTYMRHEANFNKYFVQVNFSSKRKKSLALLGREFPLNYGTALRASYVDMHDYTLNNIAGEAEDNIFLEPIFYTRLTLNPSVQLQYTSGTTIGLKNRENLTAAYSVFSLGFVINVGGRPKDRLPSNSVKAK